MSFTEHEMHGLIAGKCVAGDMKVNEELPAYLVRKMQELESERDMYRNAEMSWEKAMMSAIGEDGTGSVTKAISDLKAERDALAASFDELAKAVGWSVQQCEQTGESPMDVAVSLVNLVYELENEEPTTAGKLEKLAGAMLNRSLDSGSKQAAAYAECADMVATFAANLRKENGNG